MRLILVWYVSTDPPMDNFDDDPATVVHFYPQLGYSLGQKGIKMSSALSPLCTLRPAWPLYILPPMPCAHRHHVFSSMCFSKIAWFLSSVRFESSFTSHQLCISDLVRFQMLIRRT